MHAGRKTTITLYALLGALLFLGVSAASAQPVLAEAAGVSAVSGATTDVSVAVTASVPVTGSVPTTASAPTTYVVVIDAGHQSIRNSRLEPIGPGSKTRKPAVTSGTSGRVTHTPEQRMNLKVAVKLRDVLVAAGVKVVMVRTKEKVDITNSRRAKVANAVRADLFIRLHCDGNNSSSVHGISVLTPGKNKWTGPIVASSMAASTLISREVIATTHAKNRGIKSRTDLAGFNWCEVPTVLVEMGFMSNRTEDKLLATRAYRDKLAAGMAQGTLDYLASR